jgi:hypothetical protein
VRMTWAWLGGFFEGEGCITWYERDHRGHSGRGAVVVIGQKMKAPLVLIQEFLCRQGIQGAKLYRRKARPPKIPNGIWILQINRKAETAWFLKKIIPYLVEKRLKAKVVLEKQTAQRQSRCSVSDEDRALIVRLWEKKVSLVAIAQATGLSNNRLLAMLREAGKHTGKRCFKCTESVTDASGQGVFWL